MDLGPDIKQSLAKLHRQWKRLAESAFSSPPPMPGRSETAGGEFISAFISESDLSFPRAGERPKRGSSRTN